jgi:RimJ/RimL family protein N-acetyltransferase
VEARRIDGLRISVRDIRRRDVAGVLDYWYRSPPGHVEGMAIVPGELPGEAARRAALLRAAREALSPVPQGNILTVVMGGRAVGIHTLGGLIRGESGLFHAHLFDPAVRRRGVATISYPLACRVFFERFALKTIVFKIPVQNVGAIRVKEKLGIRCVGEEIIGQRVIRPGTRARVFELARGELAALLDGSLRAGASVAGATGVAGAAGVAGVAGGASALAGAVAPAARGEESRAPGAQRR